MTLVGLIEVDTIVELVFKRVLVRLYENPWFHLLPDQLDQSLTNL
jgi:hypothetical protein